MNRKTSRYLVPLVLIFGLIFAAAVSAAPESSPQACIATQSGADEDVVWEIRNNNSTTYSSGASFAEATGGIFTVTGQPNFSAELYVKGEDTLAMIQAVTNFPTDGADPCEDELNFRDNIPANTTVRTLLEGDITDDNVINGADFGAMATNWLGTGSEFEGDLNEDQNVNGQDFGLLASNWLAVGDGGVVLTGADGSRTVGTASIRAVNFSDFANFEDRDRLYIQIIVDNPNGEMISNVQAAIDFNETYFDRPAALLGQDCVDDGGFTNPCHMDLMGPNEGDDGDVYNFNASSTSGPVNATEIIVAALELEATQDCMSCLQAFAVEFIAADENDPQDARTQYFDTSRAQLGFANCDVAPGANCNNAGSQLNVGLSELGTQQSIVATVAALTAVLGLVTLVVTRTARRQD